MTFDSCYIIHSRQYVSVTEIIEFWQSQGYQLKNPATQKIHTYNQYGDLELIDELPSNDYTSLNFSLWASTDTDIFVTLTERTKLRSEEYGFMGTSGDEYMALMKHLNQRYMSLTEAGLLVGVFFDRKDNLLGSIPAW